MAALAFAKVRSWRAARAALAKRCVALVMRRGAGAIPAPGAPGMQMRNPWNVAVHATAAGRAGTDHPGASSRRAPANVMPIHRAPLPGTLDAPFATAQPPAGLLPDDPPSYDWLAEIARALRTGDRSVGSDDPGPAAQAG